MSGSSTGSRQITNHVRNFTPPIELDWVILFHKMTFLLWLRGKIKKHNKIWHEYKKTLLKGSDITIKNSVYYGEDKRLDDIDEFS